MNVSSIEIDVRHTAVSDCVVEYMAEAVAGYWGYEVNIVRVWLGDKDITEDVHDIDELEELIAERLIHDYDE